MRLLLSLSIILLLGSSCSIESEKINYGSDSCHFCKMTIVDSQHASEAVTSKGKVYKYDAIECMINNLKQMNEVEFSLLFVNDYSSPGALIDARKATFLISKSIKSPMGANLSAFDKKEAAEKSLKEYGGMIYDWEGIQKEIM